MSDDRNRYSDEYDPDQYPDDRPTRADFPRPQRPWNGDPQTAPDGPDDDATDDECRHGLGPIAACVICNGREKREAVARDRIVSLFAARYEGKCQSCTWIIEVGEVIGRTADDRYVCGECAETLTRGAP